VVVIIPIMVAMPTVLMFVPPLPALSPAPLASFAQFMAPMVCLPAVESMALDSLVELVFGACRAPVTIVIMPGCARHTGKQKHGGQRDGWQRPSSDNPYSRLAWYLHRTLAFFKSSFNQDRALEIALSQPFQSPCFRTYAAVSSRSGLI
jgi:hypothetical protein